MFRSSKRTEFLKILMTKAIDEDVVAGVTQYGVPIECAVQKGRLCAVQFHPEKSSKSGLALLKNFLNTEVE